MEITSRPTSSFCPPGQERLRCACGKGTGRCTGGKEFDTSLFLFFHHLFVFTGLAIPVFVSYFHHTVAIYLFVLSLCDSWANRSKYLMKEKRFSNILII